MLILKAKKILRATKRKAAKVHVYGIDEKFGNFKKENKSQKNKINKLRIAL